MARTLTFTPDQVGTIVGQVDIPAGERTTELFEFAAWYRRHEYRPGRYPVTLVAVRYSPSYVSHYNLTALDVPTTIVDANFRSHFGGVGYGDDPSGKAEIGRQDTRGFSVGGGYRLDAIDAHETFEDTVDA